MAQPAHIEIAVDTTSARQRIKRIISEAQEANRELARLEERLAEFEQRYADAVQAAFRIEVETLTKEKPHD